MNWSQITFSLSPFGCQSSMQSSLKRLCFSDSYVRLQLLFLHSFHLNDTVYFVHLEKCFYNQFAQANLIYGVYYVSTCASVHYLISIYTVTTLICQTRKKMNTAWWVKLYWLTEPNLETFSNNIFCRSDVILKIRGREGCYTPPPSSRYVTTWTLFLCLLISLLFLLFPKLGIAM